MRGGFRQNAGRKKGFAALEAERARKMIAEKLSSEFEAILDKAISQAKDGDRVARAWLVDRAYGRAIQQRDFSEDKPLPTPILINLDSAIAKKNGIKGTEKDIPK